MVNSPLLVDVKFDTTNKFGAFAEAMPDRRVILWNEEQPDDLSGIHYALVWKPDEGLLNRMPDLKAIFSAGAGVDHVLKTPDLPDLPLVRFVDPSLTNRMSEWVVLQCLSHLRQTREYDACQRAREWHPLDQPQAKDIRVGVMGLGELGLDAVKKLSALGFDVGGWSRTKKTIKGVETFDAESLDAFLSRTEFLVGLLPLTDETRGLFNRALFEKMASDGRMGRVFINAGRGGSQVERDIVSCLEDGTLVGVSLDVFETEPLPPESALWGFNNAILTPHASAVSEIAALARHVGHQIARYEAGDGLEHLVDRALGY